MNRTAIGVAALSMLLLAPAAAEMNNIDIFRMTREKASPEAVIAKIRSCRASTSCYCDFVLQPANVEMLTREGVPPEVIQAMKDAPPGPSAKLAGAKSDSNGQTKPGSSYSWNGKDGSITVTVKWAENWGFQYGLSGRLYNRSPFTISLATINFRQYYQPLSGVLTDSPEAQVKNVPANNSAVYDVIGAKISFGCAVVIDSVELYVEDGPSIKLKAADAEPYWYTGPSCYWEERKYKKANVGNLGRP